jgi:hypothetical protein
MRSVRAKRLLPQDPNRGVFVYEQQAIADVIDHAYALHHRFASTAGDADLIDWLLEQQRQLVAVEIALQTTGRSGHIRDLIRRNLEELGVSTLRAGARQLLDIQQQRLALRTERRARAWGTAMTFVFGLLAVPPVATDVIEPFWRLAAGDLQSFGRQRLLLLALAVVAVCVALGIVGIAASPRRRRR